MTTAAPSTALAMIQPAFADAKRLALAGFLAGYRGLAREAYTLDLRRFTTWCRVRSVDLFAVRRAGIESFARDLEAKGRARATVTRRPRVDYESRAVALDRNELGALLVAAGLSALAAGEGEVGDAAGAAHSLGVEALFERLEPVPEPFPAAQHDGHHHDVQVVGQVRGQELADG